VAGSTLKALKRPVLTALRGIGRAAIGSPPPPRATGGYGLASRGGLILLFLIGLALSWPLPGVGLVLMIVAWLALAQFFLLQYRGVLFRPATVAWLVAAALALGAVIVVVWLRWPGRGGTSADLTVLAAAVAGLGVLPLIRMLFTMIFGPHHPESPLPKPELPPPLWFWIGGVGPDRATVAVRLDQRSTADSVLLEHTGPSATVRTGPAPLDEHRFARFELTGLGADRHHDVRIHAMRGDEIVATVTGSFTTFPPSMEPATVSLVFASCLSTGSEGWVFDTIREATPRPRIFVVTGDLHYENITSRRAERFLEAYDAVHSSHALRRLYGSMPMAYVWDDHDFGDNDSDHSSPSKQAAQTAYRRAVPSYLDAERAGAIHQEFTIGRVRVVITDARSERGETPDHLLNPDTEDWLIDCIIDQRWPVVIWVSPTPWISSDADSDNWGAYAEQRQRIATAIGDRSRNLVMVSGDAHMVAIDDGTHSGFAGPDSGFPVLHAAALDRLGSVKGGEFSHGKYPGAGQFGVVTIDDQGDRILLELSGRTWTGVEIVSHSFTITGARSTTTAADTDPGLAGRVARGHRPLD
jgi:hypothetical protein